MLDEGDSLDLDTLGARYRAGALRPSQMVEGLLRRLSRRGDDKVWIHRLADDALRAQAAALERRGPDGLPLYGIPFAIKDNIDLAGHPTTAGCPDFRYLAGGSAPVVEKLVAAGAIPIGKTNLDQFATGLVGVRSPYGVPANSFDADYVPGGSSSGSAIAVAAGLASFALGTDTAGSGRVPAAFNNLIGLKPSCGLLSTRGVVPACRSLDCVSIFALTAADAASVLRVARGFDAADPYSRPDRGAGHGAVPIAFAGLRIGVPRKNQLEFFGNRDAAGLFEQAMARLDALGAERAEVDFAPFFATARLLYEGPWVAERYVAIRDFIEKRPEALHPVTRKIIGGATRFTAVDAFAAFDRLKALRRETAPVWDEFDILVTPTAGTIYRISEVEADPIRTNSNLGHYTNFMNLLDLSAIALPAGFQADGLPFGITLIAPAFADESLCVLADALQRAAGGTMGATGTALPSGRPATLAAPAKANATIQVAVCGAHMSGLPLNHQLTERGGRLARKCRTAPLYRFYALTEFSPPRPGLVRAESGASIEVEVWEVPAAGFGGFVDGIPAPLGIGTVALEDGTQVKGFLCEAHAVRAAWDISNLGSWRNFVKEGKDKP
ncbi:MAG: allophanate hydrolase [Alphaproteobacteria bacterium]|nr:allophanate hydrolase [Alphaproteobacteria bacterium]